MNGTFDVAIAVTFDDYPEGVQGTVHVTFADCNDIGQLLDVVAQAGSSVSSAVLREIHERGILHHADGEEPRITLYVAPPSGTTRDRNN